MTWKPYAGLWYLDGTSCYGYGHSHGVQLETACLGDAGVTVSVSAQPAKVIRVALTVPMSEISITIDRRAEIS